MKLYSNEAMKEREADSARRLAFWRQNLRKVVVVMGAAGAAAFAVIVSSQLVRQSAENRTSASNPPAFVTKSLVQGHVGEKYSQLVLGYDLDAKEGLNMRAAGLPQGLNLKNCKVEELSDKTQMSCLLDGVPQVAGNYQVRLEIKDFEGNKTTESLVLYIQD